MSLPGNLISSPIELSRQAVPLLRVNLFGGYPALTSGRILLIYC